MHGAGALRGETTSDGKLKNNFLKGDDGFQTRGSGESGLKQEPTSRNTSLDLNINASGQKPSSMSNLLLSLKQKNETSSNDDYVFNAKQNMESSLRSSLAQERDFAMKIGGRSRDGNFAVENIEGVPEFKTKEEVNGTVKIVPLSQNDIDDLFD